MKNELYPGIAFSPQATLTENIGAADTIIKVSDTSAFPEAPNLATIGIDEDGETILYTAKTAEALSGCQRGIEGAAKAWEAGEIIGRNFTAKDHNDMIENLTELEVAAQAAKDAASTAQESADEAVEGVEAIQEEISKLWTVNGMNNVTIEGGNGIAVENDTTERKIVVSTTVAVNGIPPDEEGNIPVIPPTIGAASNQNLLINHDFRDPINQKWKTKYTENGYAIDGWILAGSGSIELLSDCIELTAGTSPAAIRQRLEVLAPGIYTMSALFKMIGLLSTTVAWDGTTSIQPNIYDGIDFSLKIDNGYPAFAIAIYPGNPIKPIAAKLELGPFQTLAHQDGEGNWVLNDPPPNKQQELAKCQRYQLEVFDRPHTGQGYLAQVKAVSDISAYGLLPTPVTMREGGNPTLITDCSADNHYLAYGTYKTGYSDAGPGITAFFIYSRTENGIIIKATGSNFVPGTDYQIYVRNQGTHQFLLDRNL